jgi:hypothetical protein
MFKRNDLDCLVAEEGEKMQYLQRYRGLYYTSFPQYAFTETDGEESIRITRAQKEEGDNGLRFWINAELVDNRQGEASWILPYFSGAYFELVGEADFNSIVAENCRGLINPPKLPIIDNQVFIGALLMYSMKTEFFVSMVAEYENEYIHFFWQTTA